MRTQESIFRKTPYVLIKYIVLINFVLAVLLSIAASVIDYRALFSNASISEIIAFDLSSIAVISALEILSTIFLLKNWLNDYYTICEDTVTHEPEKKFKESMRLEDILKITYTAKFLSKVINYGDVSIKDDKGKTLVFKDVSDPLFLFSYLENLRVNREIPKVTGLDDLQKILNNGENQLIEFKSSMIWDFKRKVGSKDIQSSIIKSIAGFLNSYGGVLIIGVDDSKDVLGLKDDMSLLKKKSIDGFEAHLMQLVKDSIGIEFKEEIDITFLKVDKKDVCIVNIKQAKVPVYVKNNSTEDFYIRAGNSTHSLSISSAMRYIEEHFRKE
ncbi:ATP-binding protein [Candidatus Dojkabacteria bacterium]|jgi:hypothetical protein|nr:ATP-binding protein [Candidatus Dojkabacteria bacterium]